MAPSWETRTRSPLVAPRESGRERRILIRLEADGARAAVSAEKARASQAMAGEHDSAVKALEVLLMRHTLPDSVAVMRIAIEGGQYAAQLRAQTPYGLEWVVALEIPPAHPFAHVLRIDRVIERLEVEAPEEGGWLHKEVRIRPQRFDRLHLTELIVDPDGTTLRLRAAPDDTGGGFDILFKPAAANAQLVRVVEGGAAPDSPYDVVGDDLAKLRSLHDSLVTMVNELAEHKKALKSATLDRTTVGMLETPRVLVERLIANVAPTVQEIAKRSLVPGELVLKRLLGDNHRDEVFLSKSELENKLEHLPPALRHAFDPLKLWERHDEPINLVSPKPAAPATKEKKAGDAGVEVVDEGWGQQRPPEAVPPIPTVVVAPDPPRAEAHPTSSTTQTASQAPRPSVRPPRP